jgi:hypothetical protein
MRIVGALLATGLAGVALAQQVYVTDTGTTYNLDPVNGGAILVNADDPGDEITLAATCDADHPVLGTGDWAWTGAGIAVTFDGTTLHLDGPVPLDAPACGT